MSHAHTRWAAGRGRGRREARLFTHTHTERDVLFIYIVVVAAVGVCLTRYANSFYAFSHCLFGYFIMPKQRQIEREREGESVLVCVIEQFSTCCANPAAAAGRERGGREKELREGARAAAAPSTAAGMHVCMRAEAAAATAAERHSHAVAIGGR